MKYLALILIPFLLAGCLGPEFECDRDTRTLKQAANTAKKTLDDTNFVINNGYRVHRQSVPYTYAGTCRLSGYYIGNTYVQGTNYTCQKNGTRIQETPVSVSDKEISKLKQNLSKIKQNYINAKDRYNSAYRSCIKSKS